MTPPRRLLALVMVAVSFGVSVRGSQDSDDIFELQVALRGAISPFYRPQGASSPNLVLDLSREKGEWWPVCAMSLGYNQGFHNGYLNRAEIDGTNVVLDVMVRLGNDPWIKGGFGRYHIMLERRPDNTLVGHYEGTFAYGGTGEDLPFVGTAEGFIKPPRPFRVPDFRPLQSGEHPRLAFRKHDADKIIAKARDTRFGRDVVATIDRLPPGKNTIVSKAFMYFLTKDKKYMEEILPFVEWHMTQFDAGAKATEEWRHRVPRIATAVDLMWDGLPPDFKVRFMEYSETMTDAVCNKLNVFGSGFNFNPCSNWYAPVVGGGNVIAYMLLGEPGPEPLEPLPPMGIKTNVAVDADALAKTVARFSDPKAVKLAVRDYEWRKREWEVAHHFWKLRGTRSDYLFTFRNVSYQNYKFLRIGIGDGGFESEPGYCCYSYPNNLMAAAQHRMILGRDQSPYPDATHFTPRHMMTMLFPEGGNPCTIDIHGGGGVDITHLGVTFPLVPDELKPALLWAWNKVAGVDVNDESTYVRAVTGGGGFSDQFGVYAFVNYPLDMKPVHPREVYPKTWAASTRGMYIFRNAWEGKNDFIAQLYVYNTPIAGKVWPVAGGTFNIWGLGQYWTGDRKSGSHSISGWGFQYNAPVIYIPDAGREVRGFGHVTHYDPRTDGSAIVSIDLNDHYGRGKLVPVDSPVVDADEETKPTYHLMTARELRNKVKTVKRPAIRMQIIDPHFIRSIDPLDPEEGKGVRSIAFDYSGKSGASVLVAVADHVEMDATKEWHFTPMADVKDYPRATAIAKETLAVEGNTFTVTYPDRKQSLKATFISPPDVRIEYVTTNFNKGKTDQEIDIVTSSTVRAVGPTGNEGDFFVVFTINQNDQPKVQVDGKGMTASAVIGSRKVRFDGSNVVLE